MQTNVIYLTDARDWSYFILDELLKESKCKNWEIRKIFLSPKTYFERGPVDQLGVPLTEIDPKDIGSIYNSNYVADADILLFYGWSYLVPTQIVSNNVCVCCHAAKLPKYRGDTPMQHQIMDGVLDSAVTLFRMDSGIDTGPIFKQFPLSLKGHMPEIINRIGKVGLKATIEMLDELNQNMLVSTPQKHLNSTSFKRRDKTENELTYNKLTTFDSHQIYNFIRALEDPYANAYINLTDSKLFLKKVVAVGDLDNNFGGNPFPIVELLNYSKNDFISAANNGYNFVCSDNQIINIEKYKILD